MPTKRMKHPTIEECREYAAGMGYVRCDPDEFFFYYESNGWKVGKNPMVSWRKAMGGWESREKRRGTKPRRVRIDGDPSFEGRF